MEIDTVQLMNYGTLGLWTLSLLVDKYNTHNKLYSAIERLRQLLESKL